MLLAQLKEMMIREMRNIGLEMVRVLLLLWMGDHCLTAAHQQALFPCSLDRFAASTTSTTIYEGA